MLEMLKSSLVLTEYVYDGNECPHFNADDVLVSMFEANLKVAVLRFSLGDNHLSH